MGRIESLDYIRAMIVDDDAGIRASGAYLCGKLRLLQLKDDLVELTGDSSYQVRKTSAISLLGLGEPGKTLIESLFERGTPDQQVCAALALSLSNDRRGLDHLFSISQTEGEFSQLATELLLSTP
jgi:HEAT repeat protein